jgi:hypothetical protein
VGVKRNRSTWAIVREYAEMLARSSSAKRKDAGDQTGGTLKSRDQKSGIRRTRRRANTREQRQHPVCDNICPQTVAAAPGDFC